MARAARPFPLVRKDDGGDLVETSFLMMGLITARQYFDRERNDLARPHHRNCGKSVEWNWYRKGENVLYWHWSPNNGLAMNHHIRGWNETLITYVLAAGAPRLCHRAATSMNRAFAQVPIIATARPITACACRWARIWAARFSSRIIPFAGWIRANLRTAMPIIGSRIMAQVKINLAHCVANPGGFKGYGADCWGITASDDPDGYDAHAPGNDNGTISPTAALSSFPYAPEAAMRALRHFLKHGEVWGRYGFTDAFNETRDWWADTYLAIDQGPIVVMIENYRSGLLWKLFMAAPEVRRGLPAGLHGPVA